MVEPCGELRDGERDRPTGGRVGGDRSELVVDLASDRAEALGGTTCVAGCPQRRVCDEAEGAAGDGVGEVDAGRSVVGGWRVGAVAFTGDEGAVVQSSWVLGYGERSYDAVMGASVGPLDKAEPFEVGEYTGDGAPVVTMVKKTRDPRSGGRDRPPGRVERANEETLVDEAGQRRQRDPDGGAIGSGERRRVDPLGDGP